MKEAKTLLPTFLVLLSILVGTPNSLPQAHGTTGTVCIADFSTNPDNCPGSSANLSGITGDNLTIAVNVHDADSLNGFDIEVKTDPAVLRPVSTSLTGTLLSNPSVFQNSVDPASGRVRVAVTSKSSMTLPPTTGRFFMITYTIIDGNGGTTVDFPVGCFDSSNDSFCVTVTNPTLPGRIVPVNLLPAVFGQVIPDFTMNAQPNSLNVTQGSSASSTIRLTSINLFAGTVNLSTSPPCLSPACPSWNIDPNSLILSSGGSATAKLSFTTTSGTLLEPWIVTVLATSGDLSHSVDVTFTVLPPPPPPGPPNTVCIADFLVNPENCPGSPANLSGPVGSSLVLAVNVQDSDAFNSFDIQVQTDPSVVQPISTDFTGFVFSQAENYIVLVNTVNATTGLVRVAVVAKAFITTPPTTGRFFSITYNVVGGGGTAIFFPAGCPGSSSDSFCVILTNPNVFPVNLQTATFGEPTPDFTIAASPASQSVTQGSSASSTIILASLAGYSGTIDLTTSPPCLALTCPSWSINPTNVTLVSGGSATAKLSFLTTPATAPNTWAVNITAHDQSTRHSIDVIFTVVEPPPPPQPDFTIAASPASQNTVQGETTTFSVALTSINDFAGDVSLTTSVSPSGPLTSVIPSVVTLAAGGSAFADLSVATSVSTTPGSYQIILTGTSGSLSHSATVFVVLVTPPPVGIVCIAPGDSIACPSSPAVFQVTAGSQLVVAVNVQDSDAFNGFDVQVQTDPSVLQPISTDLTGIVFPQDNLVVLLNTVDASAGLVHVAAAAAAFFTTPPTSGRFFSITYNIVGVSPGSTIGFSSVIVTNPNLPGGTIPEDLQTATVNSQPGFSIGATPLSLSLRPGQTATSTVTLSSLFGFSGEISLSASVTPQIRRGPSVSLNPTIVTLSSDGSGTSIVTVTTPRSALPGTYTVVVTATSGSITHTVTLTITVLPKH